MQTKMAFACKQSCAQICILLCSGLGNLVAADASHCVHGVGKLLVLSTRDVLCDLRLSTERIWPGCLFTLHKTSPNLFTRKFHQTALVFCKLLYSNFVMVSEWAAVHGDEISLQKWECLVLQQGLYQTFPSLAFLLKNCFLCSVDKDLAKGQMCSFHTPPPHTHAPQMSVWHAGLLAWRLRDPNKIFA